MIHVTRRALGSLLAMGIVALVVVSQAAAHEVRPAISTLTLPLGDRAELEVRLDVEGLVSGAVVANTPENSSRYDELRAMAPEALQRQVESELARLVSRIEIRFDGTVSRLQLRALEVPGVGDKAVSRMSTLKAEAAVPLRARQVSWKAPSDMGANVIRVVEADSNRVLFAGLLQPGEMSPQVDLGTTKTPEVEFLRYVVLGFEHIVPKGLDHILFVVGLFLLNARVPSLLWQVSAFTLAHSITLALGIYGVVGIPSAIVEPVIAGSIAFIAFENLATDKLHRWRPVVVFLFGLVHGLGFAGVLEEIGLPTGEFAIALLGFNIGVELGQLAVLAICFLAVGFWFRHRSWYRRVITRPASAVIALVSCYWVIERVS